MASTEPIFKLIFGESWEDLPPVFHKHYANRPFSNDLCMIEGKLDVMCKWYIRPFFLLFGTVPTHNEKNIPVTVNFTSQMDSEAFCFERIFRFKNHRTFRFNSRMFQIKDNEVMERMNYGICWHSFYEWDGAKVVLRHKNYSLRIFNLNIFLPITWLIGRGGAEEIAVDENTFAMCATITHPLLGKIYEYKGQFKIVKQVE